MAGGFTVILIIAMIVFGGIWALIKMKEKGYSIDWSFFKR